VIEGPLDLCLELVDVLYLGTAQRLQLLGLERRGKAAREVRGRVALFVLLDFLNAFVSLLDFVGLERGGRRREMLFVWACWWVLVRVVMRFVVLVLVVERSV
jgi:hypothetical protein